MTGIKVLDDGRFFAETKDWDSYWNSLRELGYNELNEGLDQLHSAWRIYIRSGFDAAFRREFCFRYFVLLEDVLSSLQKANGSHSGINGLKTMLGFECFALNLADDSEAPAAGICTLRNPCYLLAKLKMPDALDDPRFLPIITVNTTTPSELFYHYRQYNLSIDSPMSLMFYPAVSIAKRVASFRLINSLAGGIGYSIDPRTRERAQRLYQCIIRPLLETNYFVRNGTIYVEFVDVGAGSGSLTSRICWEIQSKSSSIGSRLKFRLWFVDLGLTDPARFFHNERFSGLIDSSVFLSNDYRAWLNETQPLPQADGLRIAIVSKLFNNLSQFHIRRLSGEEYSVFLNGQSTDSGVPSYLPSICLAPSGKGPKSLLVSNSHTTLHDGRTFAQASLSRFYERLFLLGAANSEDISADSLAVPVRTFNPSCLLTFDGRSVISRLAELCDCVLIEDADLRQHDLIEHMTQFSLQSTVVFDVTKALGLMENHAYVVCPKKNRELNFTGKRIW